MKLPQVVRHYPRPFMDEYQALKRLGDVSGDSVELLRAKLYLVLRGRSVLHGHKANLRKPTAWNQHRRNARTSEEVMERIDKFLEYRDHA